MKTKKLIGDQSCVPSRATGHVSRAEGEADGARAGFFFSVSLLFFFFGGSLSVLVFFGFSSFLFGSLSVLVFFSFFCFC